MIGKRIKEIRKEAKLTQHEFAKSIFTTAKQVCRWEKDKATPSKIFLEKIATIYNVNVEWLLTGKGEKYRAVDQVMTPNRLLEFLHHNEEIEDERTGLYKVFVNAIDGGIEIRESEAEYLANVDLPGKGAQATEEIYLHELQQYRAQQSLRQGALSDEELDIIKHFRTIPEEHKSLAVDLLKALLERLQKK